MKVLMVPHAKQSGGESGIKRVIEAYFKYLPDFGVKLVPPDATSYDLKVAHAGMTDGDCDVAMLHGMHWTADYDAPLWEYRVNARIVEAVRHARAITVPSEWVAQFLRRDLRYNPYVIPHGIEAAEWAHNEPTGDYILWNKNRNADVCDPTPVVELAQRFPHAHFVTTFLPDKTDARPNIHAIGIIPHAQMKKLVQSSQVYLATTPETFGIGILEAMAAGIPVLGFAQGGILDLVVHGTNGFLVPPGDYDALSDGLAYCIRHRAMLGANGAELAKAWTWEAACEKVAACYRAALAEEHRPMVIDPSLYES